MVRGGPGLPCCIGPPSVRPNPPRVLPLGQGAVCCHWGKGSALPLAQVQLDDLQGCLFVCMVVLLSLLS